MSYLVFMTSQFDIGAYTHLSHIFKFIIHIVTCMYIKLIENINIPKIEFTGVYWPYIYFQSIIDVLFDIYDIYIQYRLIKTSIIYC